MFVPPPSLPPLAAGSAPPTTSALVRWHAAPRLSRPFPPHTRTPRTHNRMVLLSHPAMCVRVHMRAYVQLLACLRARRCVASVQRVVRAGATLHPRWQLGHPEPVYQLPVGPRAAGGAGRLRRPLRLRGGTCGLFSPCMGPSLVARRTTCVRACAMSLLTLPLLLHPITPCALSRVSLKQTSQVRGAPSHAWSCTVLLRRASPAAFPRAPPHSHIRVCAHTRTLAHMLTAFVSVLTAPPPPPPPTAGGIHTGAEGIKTPEERAVYGGFANAQVW